MKINNLIFKLLIIGIFFSLSATTFSQTVEQKSGVWLKGGGGSCFVDAYDNGAVPKSLYGFGINFQMGVTAEWHRLHVQRESRLMLGMFVTPLEGYAFGQQEKMEILYRFHDGKRNRLHLWVGGGYRGDGNLKVLPALKTAATSSTIYGNLCAEGLLQYDFAFIHDGLYSLRNLFSAYGKLILPFAGFVNCPGFSYMDNYMSDINLVNTILSTYQTRSILFAGVSTDIGLYFNLANGNRIGLSYRWDYLTTRKRAYYRFDNAFHTFAIDFVFKLE